MGSLISGNRRQDTTERERMRGLLLTSGFFCPRHSSLDVILGVLNELGEFRGKQEAFGHEIQSLFLSIRRVAKLVDVLLETILFDDV